MAATPLVHPSDSDWLLKGLNDFEIASVPLAFATHGATLTSEVHGSRILSSATGRCALVRAILT